MESVDDSLVSDTESSTAPSPVAAVAEDVAPAFLFARAFFAFLFPADPIRDGSALGDDAAASMEDAEDEEPCEEPRVLFALFFFLGTAGEAVVEVCCSRVTACCCSLAERLTVVVDPPCTGGGGNAGVSERLAISSAIVSAVAVGGAAAAVARGTSTKSAVSDRGDWRGGDVERRAEEERDQTISSSSEERESLAHRELEVSERTSSEDESEVDICWSWKGVVRMVG